eukprot:5860713-Pleurochrysis_carterae.AAC.1
MRHEVENDQFVFKTAALAHRNKPGLRSSLQNAHDMYLLIRGSIGHAQIREISSLDARRLQLKLGPQGKCEVMLRTYHLLTQFSGRLSANISAIRMAD